jgi:exodeoxyribonuclease-5
MQWSPGQEKAIATAAAWLRMRYKPWFYLAGYAGTGKTTIAKHIAAMERGETAFGAFTGKAAKVMRANGCRGAKTIHSLIYHTETNEETGAIIVELNHHALDDVSLVVVDECSMVNEEIATDLLSFGKPVLVLGDPFQLPPPRGQGYFTSQKPDAMLTEVHRQAAESPIIRLATAIREGEWRRDLGTHGDLVVTDRSGLDPSLVLDADVVIVGKNDTRHKFNARLRERRGFTSPDPQVGERIICLRNDREKRISNGEIFEVTAKGKASTRKGVGRLLRYKISDPDNEARKAVSISVFDQFFRGRADEIHWKKRAGTQEFDFASAITCHKAQGSQYSRVCVFDESAAFREHRAQWAYTAVTRASEHLTLVI